MSGIGMGYRDIGNDTRADSAMNNTGWNGTLVLLHMNGYASSMDLDDGLALAVAACVLAVLLWMWITLQCYHGVRHRVNMAQPYLFSMFCLCATAWILGQLVASEHILIPRIHGNFAACVAAKVWFVFLVGEAGTVTFVIKYLRVLVCIRIVRALYYRRCTAYCKMIAVDKVAWLPVLGNFVLCAVATWGPGALVTRTPFDDVTCAVRPAFMAAQLAICAVHLAVVYKMTASARTLKLMHNPSASIRVTMVVLFVLLVGAVVSGVAYGPTSEVAELCTTLMVCAACALFGAGWCGGVVWAVLARTTDDADQYRTNAPMIFAMPAPAQHDGRPQREGGRKSLLNMDVVMRNPFIRHRFLQFVSIHYVHLAEFDMELCRLEEMYQNITRGRWACSRGRAHRAFTRAFRRMFNTFLCTNGDDPYVRMFPDDIRKHSFSHGLYPYLTQHVWEARAPRRAPPLVRWWETMCVRPCDMHCYSIRDALPCCHFMRPVGRYVGFMRLTSTTTLRSLAQQYQNLQPGATWSHVMADAHQYGRIRFERVPLRTASDEAPVGAPPRSDTQQGDMEQGIGTRDEAGMDVALWSRPATAHDAPTYPCVEIPMDAANEDGHYDILGLSNQERDRLVVCDQSLRIDPLVLLDLEIALRTQTEVLETFVNRGAADVLNVAHLRALRAWLRSVYIRVFLAPFVVLFAHIMFTEEKFADSQEKALRARDMIVDARASAREDGMYPAVGTSAAVYRVVQNETKHEFDTDSSDDGDDEDDVLSFATSGSDEVLFESDRDGRVITGKKTRATDSVEDDDDPHDGTPVKPTQ